MAKKTFKTAAENFITTPEQEEDLRAGSGTDAGADRGADPGEGLQIPDGYKLVPETKTERLQLLLKPSIKKGLQKAAHEEYTSMNDLANDIFAEYLERRAKK
jgi:hypothetical protein